MMRLLTTSSLCLIHNYRKSTTINSYVNYLYGVQFNDPFRLKLVDEPPTDGRATMSASQTDQVFGYLLQCPPALGGKHSLLIIDTPGFGDTRGVERDLETISEIKSFFNMEVKLFACCQFCRPRKFNSFG